MMHSCAEEIQQDPQSCLETQAHAEVVSCAPLSHDLMASLMMYKVVAFYLAVSRFVPGKF